jgi:hypothetical protein
MNTMSSGCRLGRAIGEQGAKPVPECLVGRELNDCDNVHTAAA